MCAEPSSTVGRDVGGLSDPEKGRNVQEPGLDNITMAVRGMSCGVDK